MLITISGTCSKLIVITARSSPFLDCQCVASRPSTMFSGGYAFSGSLALHVYGTLYSGARNPCCVSKKSSGGFPHVKFASVLFKYTALNPDSTTSKTETKKNRNNKIFCSTKSMLVSNADKDRNSVRLLHSYNLIIDVLFTCLINISYLL